MHANVDRSRNIGSELPSACCAYSSRSFFSEADPFASRQLVRDLLGVYKKVAPRLGQHFSAAGTLSAEFGTPRSGVAFCSADATFSCGRPTKSGVGFCNLDRARQVRGGGAQSSAAPICAQEHGARTIATSSAVGTRAKDNQRAERHTLRTLRRM